MLRPQSLLLAGLLAAASAAAFAQNDFQDKSIVRERTAAQRFDVGRKWAVVIGVNDYVDERITDLRCCVEDAKLVAKTLAERCGYPAENILTITDDQARAHLRPLRASLQQQVSAWLKFAGEEDTVLVFFSGHGFLDDRGQGFLATQDARMDFLGLTALRTDELREMLRQCKAGQKVLVLDCCHAGAEKDLSAESPSSEELGAAFRSARGLVTLASCGRDEKSREWEEKGHGLFTYFLAEGLQGKADRDRDGIVTSDELYLYTHNQVQTSARRLFGQAQQPRRIIGEDVVGVFALARLNGPAPPSADVSIPPVASSQIIRPSIDAKPAANHTAAINNPAARPEVTAAFTVRIGGADGELAEGAEVELWFRQSAGAKLQLLAHGLTGSDGRAILTMDAAQAAARGEFAVMASAARQQKVWDLPDFPRLRSYNLVLPMERQASEVPRSRHDHGKTFTNSIGMKLVQVPALPQRIDWASIDELDEELLADDKVSQPPLYFGLTEVTVGQFRKFVQATGYKTEAERGEGGSGWNEKLGRFEAQNQSFTWKATGFEQTDSHPVVNVTWNDAAAFCRWLSQREGRMYRLPTQAEWEFACRGGSRGRWSCGERADDLALVGNVADATAKTKFASWDAIAAHDGYVFTSPVGSFQANSFGLYDMHGNVWEWCHDAHEAPQVVHSAAREASCSRSLHRASSTRATTVKSCALRGGSWLSIAEGAAADYSNWNSPSLRSVDLGFRVVLVP